MLAHCPVVRVSLKALNCALKRIELANCIPVSPLVWLQKILIKLALHIGDSSDCLDAVARVDGDIGA